MNEPADGATTMKKKAAEKLAAKAAPVETPTESNEAVVPAPDATEVAEVVETPVVETPEAPVAEAEATPEAAAE
jgi:small subunit ribosomal protein S16